MFPHYVSHYLWYIFAAKRKQDIKLDHSLNPLWSGQVVSSGHTRSTEGYIK